LPIGNWTSQSSEWLTSGNSLDTGAENHGADRKSNNDGESGNLGSKGGEGGPEHAGPALWGKKRKNIGRRN